MAAIGYSTSPYNYIQTKAFAWSPDSASIAYISTRNGASNIWLAGLRDSSDKVITKNADPELAIVCPIWSSDGKRLAYSTELRDNGKTVRGLEVLDLGTGEVNKLMETTEPTRLIGWTADESALIIAASEANSSLPPVTNLRRVALAGGTQSSIADLKNIYFYNIFLSDDRKFIAYAARTDNKDDIWVLPSVGGAARKVTNNNDSGLYYSRLAWLHDGSSIVFGKQTRYSLLSIITGMN
jgi:Tol biopolymer transport system component